MYITLFSISNQIFVLSTEGRIAEAFIDKLEIKAEMLQPKQVGYR